MSFNFFSSQQQQKIEEEKSFQLSDQMKWDEIPEKVRHEIIEIHQMILKNRELLNDNENGKSKTADDEEKEVQNSLYDLSSRSKEELFGNLTSLAHQIDYGKRIINEYKEDFSFSKNCYNTSNALSSFPSPFLSNYSKHLEEEFRSLDQEITAYSSQFNFSDKSVDDNIFFKLFEEENNAICRTSTKLTQLLNKYANTRLNLYQKLKITQPYKSDSYTFQDQSYAKSIELKFKQFKSEQTAKQVKNLEHSDLFGVSNQIEETKSNSLFGNSFGTGYTGFSSSSLTQRSQNGFKAPPPVKTAPFNVTTSKEPPAAPSASNSGYSPFK